MSLSNHAAVSTTSSPTSTGGDHDQHDAVTHQNQIHDERMAQFMSADGKWIGGFSNCSKRVQGVLIYQIGKNAWLRGDFNALPPGHSGFKDAVAKKYMEFQHIMRTAQRIKCSMGLKDLLTMPAKNINKCIPSDILKKFKQRQTITDTDLKDLTQHPSGPRPLVLMGRKDKKILAFRMRIPDHFIETLKQTKHLLPKHVETSGRRGDYKTRNYCLWAKYAKHPYMSADLLEDGPAAKEWLSAQALLFKYLSEVLKLVDFESYETMTNHPWLDKLIVNKAKSLGQKIVLGSTVEKENIPLHKVAGIWYGLAVNCDQEFAGVPHRDGNDMKNSMNCIRP